MESNTDYNERAYTTSELAGMLGIAVPTVRKYAQSLERAGYVFIKGKGKGKHPSRLFVENDIMAFRYIIQLRSNSNITVDESVSIVINKFGKGAIQSIRHDDTANIKPYEAPYSELKELIQEQNELIKGFSERLDKQETYINETLKERDKLLINTMNELMDSKKQIATTEQKKGFFARLFSKQG